MAQAGSKPEINEDWIDRFREALALEDIKEVKCLTANKEAMVSASINPIEWAVKMGKNKAPDHLGPGQT